MAGKNKVEKVQGAASPVAKSLSPEEQSIIANIQSLLDQLGQEQAPAEEPMAPEAGVEMAEHGEPDQDEFQGVPDDDEDDVMKSEVANDPAEERMSELPDDDKEALTVLKALMHMGTVQKSARPVDPTVAALQGVAKALQRLQRQSDEQGQALVGILEGFGVADAVVQKSAPAGRRVAQSSGVDAAAVLKALLAQAAPAAPAQQEEAGGIADVLKALVTQ